jgi:hypothetical protein
MKWTGLTGFFRIHGIKDFGVILAFNPVNPV